MGKIIVYSFVPFQDLINFLTNGNFVAVLLMEHRVPFVGVGGGDVANPNDAIV